MHVSQSRHLRQCSRQRRDFLTACGSVATGLATWQLAGESAPAIEPIARNGRAKFKFSLAAYSYRSLLQGKPAKLTLSDFIRDCAQLGLEGTELTSYYFPQNLTLDYLRQLKSEAFRLGLDVSGTAVGNDFGHTDPARRKQQIADVKRWIDYAEILSAPVIRIFAGHAQPGSSPAEAHRLMVSGIEECCDYAGQHGVHLALENHGGPTSTADGLLAFVRDVKSPWFGVNMDTGNFHSDDIYGDLARVAPYTLNVQVKVVVSESDGKKRPSDFRQLARLLTEADYRGNIEQEKEEAGDPQKESARFLDQLRQAFV